MKYKSVKDLPDDLFRRLIGLKRSTFHKAAEILQEALGKKHAKGGRNAKLYVEDMLLMTLEYLRE
ncbi:MAG: IS5/IS1182 family transposase, partial [Alphaproteobacteria bacterium]